MDQVITKYADTFSIDTLETEFNSFIDKMEQANIQVSANINMDELDEISTEILKRKKDCMN